MDNQFNPKPNNTNPQTPQPNPPIDLGQSLDPNPNPDTNLGTNTPTSSQPNKSSGSGPNLNFSSPSVSLGGGSFNINKSPKENKNGKKKKVLIILLTLIILAAIGAAGYFFVLKEEDPAPLQTDNSTLQADDVIKEEPEEAYTLPAGYKIYENKEIGFSLAYPEGYGDFVSQKTEGASVSMTSSKQAPLSLVVGSTSPIGYRVLSKPTDEFYSVKYGPTVKFENGKLIVTEVNGADKVNKAGTEYKNWNAGYKTGKTLNNVRGLTVYNLGGVDESSTTTKLAFMVKESAVIIDIPPFSDGMMGCFDENCKPKDITEYNRLVENILNSISKTES